MRALSVFVLVAANVACGSANHGHHLTAGGVGVVVPSGWHLVRPADPGPVIDPQTLLVVGTDGVRPRQSQCQIAAYRVPPAGAAVVVVAWADLPRSGSAWERAGRRPLKQLTRVRRPSFECFTGRGAATDVRLRGTVYQVNVMVGDRASRRAVRDALAVARSFNVVR